MYERAICLRMVAASVCGLLGAWAVVGAELRVASVFSNHAVLQRDAEVPVWGTGRPGDVVSVSFAGQVHGATVAADGRWKVALSPMEASSVGRKMEISASGGEVRLTDVVVGEVWVCAGQSNMTLPLRHAADAAESIAASDVPTLRLLQVPKRPSRQPEDAMEGAWAVAGPEVAAEFSAVAYHFGQQLERELGVPVGIIHSSWGGTVVQNWSPRAVLEDERFRGALVRDEQRLAALAGEVEAYGVALARWEALPPEQKSSTTRPTAPLPEAQKGGPGYLYNGMIAPLVPYAVKGVVWFQGESNRRDPVHYRMLLPEMIRGWRADWGLARLPFVIIQLANYQPPAAEAAERGVVGRSVWAEIRDIQREVAATIGDAALVVTIDLGETDDLHPKNKRDVGHRAVASALALVYERHVAASGPVYQAMKTEGRAAVLSFVHTTGGLVQRGETLTGFTVCGADGVFYPAKAWIRGDEVVVESQTVAEPCGVRYLWAAAPTASLYNGAGLPAGPFTTTDWAPARVKPTP